MMLMARKRTVGRPAQGRNSIKPLSKRKIVGPLVRTAVHARPSKKVY